MLAARCYLLAFSFALLVRSHLLFQLESSIFCYLSVMFSSSKPLFLNSTVNYLGNHFDSNDLLSAFYFSTNTSFRASSVILAQVIDSLSFGYRSVSRMDCTALSALIGMHAFIGLRRVLD